MSLLCEVRGLVRAAGLRFTGCARTLAQKDPGSQAISRSPKRAGRGKIGRRRTSPLSGRTYNESRTQNSATFEELTLRFPGAILRPVLWCELTEASSISKVELQCSGFTTPHFRKSFPRHNSKCCKHQPVSQLGSKSAARVYRQFVRAKFSVSGRAGDHSGLTGTGNLCSPRHCASHRHTTYARLLSII